MLDAHTREPIKAITQRYLSVLRFCRWSKLVRHQKSAPFGSEIRMERPHSIFCTNRHEIDIIITVLYYSIVGLNTPIQEKTMEFSMLHRHLIFSFVIGTTDRYYYLLMIGMFIYIYIKLPVVCTGTTYL